MPSEAVVRAPTIADDIAIATLEASAGLHSGNVVVRHVAAEYTVRHGVDDIALIPGVALFSRRLRC